MPEVSIMRLKLLEIFNKKGDTISYEEMISFPNLVEEIPELVDLNAVEVEAFANYIAAVYNVRAKMRTEATLKCTRCLEHFPYPIEDSFNETFVERKDLHHIDADENDSGLNIVDGEEIDFNQYVMEHVNMAIPFVALCREDCRGLCYECGINLNESSCECKRERIDPRLAGLANLFKDMNKDQ